VCVCGPKKCNNAQCILRYVSKNGRWEILSTQSSNKVAYYKVTTEKDPKKVDLSKGWQKGEIGRNANPATMKVTFTCTDYVLPETCNECDHLTDASCLSSGHRLYQIKNRYTLICSIFTISLIALFFR